MKGLFDALATALENFALMIDSNATEADRRRQHELEKERVRARLAEAKIAAETEVKKAELALALAEQKTEQDRIAAQVALKKAEADLRRIDADLAKTTSYLDRLKFTTKAAFVLWAQTFGIAYACLVWFDLAGRGIGKAGALTSYIGAMCTTSDEDVKERPIVPSEKSICGWLSCETRNIPMDELARLQRASDKQWAIDVAAIRKENARQILELNPASDNFWSRWVPSFSFPNILQGIGDMSCNAVKATLPLIGDAGVATGDALAGSVRIGFAGIIALVVALAFFVFVNLRNLRDIPSGMDLVCRRRRDSDASFAFRRARPKRPQQSRARRPSQGGSSPGGSSRRRPRGSRRGHQRPQKSRRPHQSPSKKNRKRSGRRHRASRRQK